MSVWERLFDWGKEDRRAPRMRVPTMRAFYWDGAAPVPHGIRDISGSGMYVYTGERWYPGTLVLMRLQRDDCPSDDPRRSVPVLSRVVRWGADGVGLEFVFPEADDLAGKAPPIPGGVAQRDFKQFLSQLENWPGKALPLPGTKRDRVRGDAPGRHSPA